MASPHRQNGGAIARVRLTDIDLAVRRRAGDRMLAALMRELAGDYERLAQEAAELHAAVERPSDRQYGVSVEAYQRVMGR